MTATQIRSKRDEKLKTSLEDLDIPNNDLSTFKRFFGFTRENEQTVGNLRDIAREYSDSVLDSFFSHVLAQPEAAKFFGNPRVFDPATQSDYFRALTTGRYDADYFESRLEAGVTHNSIDLPPKWYIGAMAYYLDCVGNELRRSFQDEPDKAFDCFRSFSKLMMLDLAIVMESYTMQRSRQLENADKVSAAEEYMRGVLNAAERTAIYAIDPDGIIQSWNSGSANIFGFTESEAIGMDFRRFYPKEELDKNIPEWEIRQASSKGTINLEGWRLHKGDKRFYAQASLSPVRDSAGNLIALVKVVLDHTERKNIEIKLEEQRKEMFELINVLNGATAQISAVASQLSSSTAQATAAIAETTSTAEEVKQTAEQTSDKAKAVSDDARTVVQVSRQGQDATGATIKGMLRIREQMESIAECMGQLSNQSKLIGDIIATVDDLAQQSNLLAVNASIEAAKAGEQGKGFAVVAQEVKNLSQQSKAATSHVRSILNDIMKATGAATMATEHGGKAVEIGHEQATEAGQVIKTLSDSIEKASQATEVIEVSSQQQLIGMKQMVEAMESIKLASEQNLTSASQLERSAKELSELGLRMQKLGSE